MKRYLLFAGSIYYPYGGWEDFQGSFDTLEEAENHPLPVFEDECWYHVFDMNLEKIVSSG